MDDRLVQGLALAAVRTVSGRATRAAALLLVVGAGLAPGAPGAGGVAAAQQVPGAPPAQAPPAAAQPAPAAPDDSPLRRRDTPPGDVQAQLNLDSGVAADLAWCRFDPAGGVTNRDGSSDCAVAAGAPLGLQFAGLTPGGDLTVQVISPQGTPQQATVQTNADGLGEWDWLSLPDDPLGTYVVSASQDSRQISGGFTVRQATSPQIMTLPDSGRGGPVYATPTGAPGTAFRVVLSGFPAGQAVPLRVYRALGGTFLYATDLGTVPANAQGAATYTLRTAAGDSEGNYLIVSEPRVAGPAQLRGEIRLSARPDAAPLTPDADTNALALALVEQANSMWVRVIGRSAPPVTDLETAFTGTALVEARAAVDAMRGQGMYREARLTAPFTLESARRTVEGTTPRLEATVVEQWDDRMFNRDGSLLGTLPSRLEQRYTFELRQDASPRCQNCWLIVNTELVSAPQ
jgi:hypothetical protein